MKSADAMFDKMYAKSQANVKMMLIIISLPPAQTTPSKAQEKTRLSTSRYDFRLSQNCKGAPLRPELHPLPLREVVELWSSEGQAKVHGCKVLCRQQTLEATGPLKAQKHVNEKTRRQETVY